jgi:hypothetical protein
LLQRASRAALTAVLLPWSSAPARCSGQWGADGCRAALEAGSAARIVKCLDPAAYAGHGLRSGFLTSAAESGASIFKLSEVSRHKSLDTLRGYVRRVCAALAVR